MNKQGFTLIEVLLVVAIVLILTAALTISSFQSLNRSREASLRHYLHQVQGTALTFHIREGRYPFSLAELIAPEYGLAPPRPEYNFVYAGGDTSNFCASGRVGQISLRIDAQDINLGSCP